MTYRILSQIGSGNARKLRRAARSLGWLRTGRLRWQLPAEFDWNPGRAAQLLADRAGTWCLLGSTCLSASREPETVTKELQDGKWVRPEDVR